MIVKMFHQNFHEIYYGIAFVLFLRSIHSFSKYLLVHYAPSIILGIGGKTGPDFTKLIFKEERNYKNNNNNN